MHSKISQERENREDAQGCRVQNPALAHLVPGLVVSVKEHHSLREVVVEHGDEPEVGGVLLSDVAPRLAVHSLARLLRAARQGHAAEVRPLPPWNELTRLKTLYPNSTRPKKLHRSSASYVERHF